jgi:predicted MFS family arabinose efflux permease
MKSYARALRPFETRDYRFQFPSDLAASWSFEMEQIALGWYVLTETGSVKVLAVYAALLMTGTILSPVFGGIGDRIGHRNLLAGLRAFFTLLALTVLTLATTGLLQPAHVLVIGGIFGLVRPSDGVIRNALVGVIIPADATMAAMGSQRIILDSARIAGALTGAGLVATFGLSLAYVAITLAYAVSTMLMLGIPAPNHPGERPQRVERASHAQDLKQAFAYVMKMPYMVATLTLACLINLTAFPLVGGLLAYVAKDLYHVGQSGLGYLVASIGFGSVLGSVVISQFGTRLRPARVMIVGSVAWHAAMLLFAQIDGIDLGIAVLFMVGLLQAATMVPMSLVLMRNTEPQFRGRVFGLRSLAVYSLPISVLVAGPLIEKIGYAATAGLYSLTGGIATALIALIWRRHIWQRDAVVNSGLPAS